MMRAFCLMKGATWTTLVIVVVAMLPPGPVQAADESAPDGARAPDMTPLRTVFEKERSEDCDVILFRNKDVLRGTILNESLGISTPYGEVRVVLRRCAGVSFEGSRANTEALVTVNRNRLSGIINDRSIRFRIGSSGQEIDIRKEKIKYILLRRVNDELDFVPRDDGRDLFVMTNGDLLTGNPVEDRIAVTTDYGSVNVGFDEMRKIEMQGGDNVTAVITKKNKDVMRGTLDTEEITLRLELGVSVESVYKDKLAKVFVDHLPDDMLAHFGALQPVRGESDGASSIDPMPAGGPRELKLDLGQGISMEFILVPAGEFEMGSPVLEAGRDEDEHYHRVRITKPFYLAKYETTQAQWMLVMGGNPAEFKGMQNPVEQVSWGDCQKFIGRLGKLLPGRKFRLPTEAEWEYACRAGTKTRFSFGDRDEELGNYAWFKQNSGGKTHPVGSKRPNPWGLYDMHGNVWEWCHDWSGQYQFTIGGMVSDPVGPGSGAVRVLRGGSWYNYPGLCRSAARDRNTTVGRFNHLGFRVVFSAAAGTW